MMGARPGRRGMGRSELGAGSQVPPMRRERRDRGEGVAGAAMGTRCACEADESMLRSHPDARCGRRSFDGGVRV
jgi:hypothetical protein